MDAAVAKIPLGRGGRPEDIGNGVVPLLSNMRITSRVCLLAVGGGKPNSLAGNDFM